jgi:hypothetical protein
MPRRGGPLQSPTVDRLSARADGLRRRSVGGGEVFTGDLADRALKALGARAMTVDQAIVMPQGFDPNQREDAALFAHEQYHLKHSGGEGAHHARDSEEIAARAQERMVLHTSTGGVESHEASHQKGDTGTPSTASSAATGTTSSSQTKGPHAARGFEVMTSRGMSRDEIVRRLVGDVMHGLDQARERAEERHANKRGLT